MKPEARYILLAQLRHALEHGGPPEIGWAVAVLVFGDRSKAVRLLTEIGCQPITDDTPHDLALAIVDVHVVTNISSGYPDDAGDSEGEDTSAGSTEKAQERPERAAPVGEGLHRQIPAQGP